MVVDRRDGLGGRPINSTDYHDEMNSEHYMEWFTKQLLPNIPDTTIIVVDNVAYHNKQKDKPPITANKKTRLNAV